MTDDEKKQVAIFRLGVIGEFVNGPAPDYGEKQRLLRDKCARKWDIPHSAKTRISRSTNPSVDSRYKAGDKKLEALYPKDRNDRGKSRSMDEDTSLALINLRHELPNATAVELWQKCKTAAWSLRA
ncbi:MAG: hypothetical protein U5J98_00360 [Halobacteriales archaeon]|nr:hypothetical protein [Halobacteriales archaeon]